MTRATGGGLLMRWRFRYTRSFSLWCGDGCKPAIPLPDGHEERWLHLPPAPPVPDGPVDWAALIADDPRPPAVRNRYEEGTRIETSRPLASNTARATQAGQTGPDDGTGASQATASVVGSDDHRAEQILWREQVEPLLPEGSTLDSIRCHPAHCLLSGHATAMAQVSSLLRALDTGDRPMPELLLIEADGPSRHRFQIHLPPSP